MTAKKCTLCGAEKPLDAFYKSGTGLSARCAECLKAYARDNKERVAKRLATPEGRVVRLWHGAKARAAKFGIPFTITQEWVLERVSRGVCEVTGIPLVIQETGRTPWSPSLDQRDPRAGYTPENTQITCYVYNLAKSDFRHEDVVALAKALCV